MTEKPTTPPNNEPKEQLFDVEALEPESAQDFLTPETEAPVKPPENFLSDDTLEPHAEAARSLLGDTVEPAPDYLGGSEEQGATRPQPEIDFFKEDAPNPAQDSSSAEANTYVQPHENFLPDDEAKDVAPNFLDDNDQALALGNPQREPSPSPQYEAQRQQSATIGLPTNLEKTNRSGRIKNTIGKSAAAVAGLTAIVAGAHAMDDNSSTPNFSGEETTYTVQPGDGIFDAAETIKGVDAIDIRDAVKAITNDPNNAEALKNGLQPGEQLTIPTAVEGHESDQ